MDDEITLTAAIGYEFVNWTGIVEHITDAGAETTTVNMPAGNVELTANFAEIHVSIEKLVEADIKIFPNPARSKFTIESYKNINHIRLVDINGQVIKDKAMNKKHKLNVHDLQPGIYFIQIHTKNSVITKSVLVAR